MSFFIEVLSRIKLGHVYRVMWDIVCHINTQKTYSKNHHLNNTQCENLKTCITNQLTHELTLWSRFQSPSWEFSRSSGSWDIPCILWNLKVLYCICNSPPPVPFLSQISTVHAPPSYFLKIHFDIIPPSVPGSPKWSIQLYSKENWNVYQHCPTSSRTILQSDHEQRNVHPQNYLSFSDQSYLIISIGLLFNLLTVCFTALPLLQTIQRRRQGSWWLVNWMWFRIRLHYSGKSTVGVSNIFFTKGHKIHVRLTCGPQVWKQQWMVCLIA